MLQTGLREVVVVVLLLQWRKQERKGYLKDVHVIPCSYKRAGKLLLFLLCGVLASLWRCSCGERRGQEGIGEGGQAAAPPLRDSHHPPD